MNHAWSELITERKAPARVCRKCGECWYEIEGHKDPEPTSECIPTPTHDRHRLKLLERDLRRAHDGMMQNFGVSMLVREGDDLRDVPELIRLKVDLERANRHARESEHDLDALLIALQGVPNLPDHVLEICNGYWGDPLW